MRGQRTRDRDALSLPAAQLIRAMPCKLCEANDVQVMRDPLAPLGCRNLGELKKDSRVNLEVDLVARYVERMLNGEAGR